MRHSRDRARFMAMVPGPSRMLRPEFPNRKGLSGPVWNAPRLNHELADGLGRPPFAVRSGRVACPKSADGPDNCGVKGAPLYTVPLPASCHPRTRKFWLKGSRQAKFMLNTWRMSKFDRPRSAFRSSEF